MGFVIGFFLLKTATLFAASRNEVDEIKVSIKPKAMS